MKRREEKEESTHFRHSCTHCRHNLRSKGRCEWVVHDFAGAFVGRATALHAGLPSHLTVLAAFTARPFYCLGLGTMSVLCAYECEFGYGGERGGLWGYDGMRISGGRDDAVGALFLALVQALTQRFQHRVPPAIAIYFAFLGMYTRWLLFPAAFGHTLQLIDFGWANLSVIEIGGAPCLLCHGDTLGYNVFSVLEAWPISSVDITDEGYKITGRKESSWQPPMELMKVLEYDRIKEKEAFQKSEWLWRFMRFRNDAFIIFSIICLQLPFESGGGLDESNDEVVGYGISILCEGLKGIFERVIAEFGGREDQSFRMLSEALTMVIWYFCLFSKCRANARKGMMCPWAMNRNNTTSSFSSAIFFLSHCYFFHVG
ncbi:hypothetical protein V8G54_002539 [Vigna mungo]|uniref:Anoctamin transmembrane domain-containing protein n=1 Tax=Vigna mungo TaxID=3915 RepID=A0AAQ3PAD4_VIGMU